MILAPLWGAIRFGPLAGSSLATMVALYITFATVAGIGPFISGDQDRSALLTQEFVVVFTAMVLYLAAFVHQNRRKSYELRKVLGEVRELNEALEDRAKEQGRDRAEFFFDAG